MGLVHNLIQAAIIMTLGMTVTFSFLAALIIMIKISSMLIAKYVQETTLKHNDTPPPKQHEDNGALIAAITMAVKKYHSENTK